jgi:hypothetical protein
MKHLDYNNTTAVFLRGPCRDVISKGQSRLIVLYGSMWRDDLIAWSWKISTVRSRCHGTACEDTTGWKRLSGCCGDFRIVETSGGAVIACTYELCVKVVNKSNIQTKTQSIDTFHSYYVNVYWPIILKGILKKEVGEVCTEFNLVSLGPSDGLLWIWEWNFSARKRYKTPWPAGQLSASQELLFCSWVVRYGTKCCY